MRSARRGSRFPPPSAPHRSSGLNIQFSSSDSDEDIPVLGANEPSSPSFEVSDQSNGSDHIPVVITSSSWAPTSSSPLPPPPSSNPPPEPIPRATAQPAAQPAAAPVANPASAPAEPQVYSLAWSRKGVTHHKHRIRMCANDQPLFFAKECRHRDSPPFFVIADRADVDDETKPGCRGQLFHGKRRFWLQLKGAADYEFGFSLYDMDGKSVARAFRVVIPIKRPYKAESAELELSQLAKKGEIDSEKFLVYGSKLPENKGGKMVLEFGAVYVVTSVKNFIVEDEEKRPLFMIYRSSSATCTVKVWEPLLPIVAFAWAVAIITTDN